MKTPAAPILVWHHIDYVRLNTGADFWRRVEQHQYTTLWTRRLVTDSQLVLPNHYRISTKWIAGCLLVMALTFRYTKFIASYFSASDNSLAGKLISVSGRERKRSLASNVMDWLWHKLWHTPGQSIMGCLLVRTQPVAVCLWATQVLQLYISGMGVISWNCHIWQVCSRCLGNLFRLFIIIYTWSNVNL